MRRRLDLEMVRRGIASTRSEAAVAIRSGHVTVGHRPATGPSSLVLPEEPIHLEAPARRFVSRGGEKLEAALDGFGIDVRGVLALDAGASTGGFTQCLLTRGARRVIAVDVGYGQLDWALRQDPRVFVLERTNVRSLESRMLPYRPELITADLSFISLSLALPPLAGVCTENARFILLVKPQFEAGRGRSDKGVVTDPSIWRRVLASITELCAAEGIAVLGLMASPLLGPAGNVEFLLHGSGGNPPSIAGLPAAEPSSTSRAGDTEAHGLSATEPNPFVERAIEQGILLRAARA